jgi:hypothetical protein
MEQSKTNPTVGRVELFAYGKRHLRTAGIIPALANAEVMVSCDKRNQTNLTSAVLYCGPDIEKTLACERRKTKRECIIDQFYIDLSMKFHVFNEQHEKKGCTFVFNTAMLIGHQAPYA